MNAVDPRPGRSLPLTEWPPIDRTLWSPRSGKPKLTDKPRPHDKHRPATRQTLQKIYGQWLAWLTDRGALDPASTPQGRITKTLLLEYVTALRARPRFRAQTVLTKIESIDTVIAAIVPHFDRKLLKIVIAHLRQDARAQGAIKRKLVPVRDLYELGVDLMSEAAKDRGAPQENAVLFRDGLVIALLAAIPVRRKNAYAIHIGQNLIWNGEEPHLCFSPHEMKNHRPAEAVCANDLPRYLRTYLSIYRPILLAQRLPASTAPEPALWLNLQGKPLSYDGFYWIVKSHTRAKFGLVVGPHQFRRCAATSVGSEDPLHVGVASSILTHHDPSITEGTYNQASSLTASRRYNDTVRETRRELRKNKRSRAHSKTHTNKSAVTADFPSD